MESAHERSVLIKLHRTAVILAAAVLASLPLYVLVVELFLRKGFHPAFGLRPGSTVLLRYVLYGAAVAAVILLRILRGMILRKKPGEHPARLGRRMFQASVLSAALAEVPALLGLLLFLTAGLIRDFYILTFVSLLLVFMFFPRLRHWMEWTES